MSGKKGITLISLVVTIIVLLILAGVSVSMLTGQNGILTRAAESKEKTEIASEREEIQMVISNTIYNDNEYKELEKEKLQIELDKEGVKNSEVIDVGNELQILLKTSKRYYTVERNGKITDVQSVPKINYAGDITKNGKYDGTEEKPYNINCIEDLVSWSRNYNQYINSYIKLCNDLNFKSKIFYENSESTEYGDLNNDGNVDKIIDELNSGLGFSPIGAFYGNFDGNYKKISNIYIDRRGANVGFFSSINGNTIVKNLSISGEIKSKSTCVGGISGILLQGGKEGKIENCHNYCNIIGSGYIGGIIGYVKGWTDLDSIFNCSNSGVLKSTNDLYVGGIVGNNDSQTMKIERCFNSGEIEGAGITANNKSFVSNCYNIGKTQYGLVYANQNEVKNCYNAGICTSGYVVKYNHYTASHMYRCFSEKKFARYMLHYITI